MLIVLSPAKTLDWTSPLRTKTYTTPAFLDQSESLVENLRDYDLDGLKSLMKISDKIATLNAERYAQFTTPFSPENARQALLAFKGDSYLDFAIEQYDEEDFAYAQQHLRILSGLYGLLRPLDLIQPYRLEMGTKLKNERGKNLYAFWGDRLRRALAEDLAAQGDDILINLASNEYFKSVAAGQLDADIVTPVFKDLKGGQYKIISFFAKKARGQMARFIIERELNDPDGLKTFKVDGYRYNRGESSARELVFTRDIPPSAG